MDNFFTQRTSVVGCNHYGAGMFPSSEPGTREGPPTRPPKGEARDMKCPYEDGFNWEGLQFLSSTFSYP